MDKQIQRTRRNTLGDLLTRTVARYPKKRAFLYKDRDITYEELDMLVNQTANGLWHDGVKKGDRLAVLSKNNLDFVIVTFALARIGAVMVPMNYMLKEKDIAYILKDAEVIGMFAESEFITVLDDASEGLEIRHRFVIESLETPESDVWILLDELQKSQPIDHVEETILDDDLAHVLYTSGTESDPKGVMLSHKSIIHEYVSCVIDGYMDVDDIFVHALPFYHSAQLHVFLGPSIYIGATGIILDVASPEKMMETIERYGANQLFAPPTVWIAMLRHPKFDAFNLTTLEKCYYGAAIMPREVLRELTDRLPNAKFWNFYGQTEVAPLATALQPEDQLRKLGSAGKPALHVETKIVDDDGLEVARGEIGEIVHRTPHAMIGYLNNPDKTSEAFQNGWFHSGDLGVMDEEGYITIVDRKKDMINTGGINVASREVEEVIYEMEEVAEVAVIGVQDDYWIEAIAAVIVQKDGQIIKEEAVMEFCKAVLPSFKVPKQIHYVEQLPKNPSGKVLKKDLRDKFQ